MREPCWPWWGIAGVVAAVAVGAANANAMQFHALPFGDQGTLIIRAEGEIIPGDLDRLRALIAGSSPDAKFAGYALDSPGGNLLEAERLATVIQKQRTNVIISPGARCVSACFLLFAAGAGRFVAPDALVGVHSASDAGKETPVSMVATTAMARDAAALGVPPAIIGKMVSAEPGQMDWLTRDDLAAMNVVIIQPTNSAEATSPPFTTAMATPAPPAVDGNTAGTTPAIQEEPPAFQQGLADRRRWEQWYASLSGDYKQGAFYWSAHRSDTRLPSCFPGDQNIGEWTEGCLAAQQLLAHADVRRKAEPVYRQGWNSY